MHNRIRIRSLCLIAFSLCLITLFAPAAAAKTAAQFADTTISGPSPFTTGCNGGTQSGSNYLNAEVEPWVAVNPKDPTNIIGVWQQDRWTDGGANGLGTGVTHDGGQTWTDHFAHFSNCAGGTVTNGGNYERASDPWVTFAANGDAYQISLSVSISTDNTSGILVSKSTDGGDTWGEPTTLRKDVNPSDGGFNDKESITADPKRAKYVYAVWDRGTQNTQPMWFSRTTNGGKTWQKARIIHKPQSGSYVIGSQIVVLPNGTLIAGYASVGAGDREPNTGSAPNLPGVFIIRSTNKGRSWSKAIKVGDFLAAGVTDPGTSQPLRTADILPEFAVDAKTGALYATWQDSRFSNSDHDSIAFAKSTNGGKTWSAPVRINAAPNVPAFNPAIHVADDGTIGISYYDFRNYTTNSPTLDTNYWLALSSDKGATWRETGIAGPFDMRNAPDAGGLFVGDYEGLATAGNNFITVFATTNTGNTTNRTDVFASALIPSTAGNVAYPAGAAPATVGTVPHIDWLKRLRAHQDSRPLASR